MEVREPIKLLAETNGRVIGRLAVKIVQTTADCRDGNRANVGPEEITQLSRMQERHTHSPRFSLQTMVTDKSLR